MHPAYSVILFTTASGAGYGLLALLSLGGLMGLTPLHPWMGFTGFLTAFVLITAGLLSSTFHLGHPERSWRAFSQWRSSWLSREGVAAVLTYAPAGLFGLAWFLGETAHWAWSLAGWAGIVCAIATVYCTGMIYASLKTIRQWYTPLVAPIYVLMAAATGALLLNLLLVLFGALAAWALWLAVGALAVAFLAKIAYWFSIDNARKTYTAESATGLGRFGKVRPLDAPHSRANFIMREMGYAVGRKHSRILRRLAVILLFAVPLISTSIMIAYIDGALLPLALLATVSAGIGVAIERWLFFAEASHVAMLFYGNERA